jgi:hypothetical protein
MDVTFSERLVTKLAGVKLWRAPATRRGFLAAAALGGAALATEPWGYLTRPQSAYAAVCGPGAACNDGWSAMCCSINQGHNTCPPGSYPGGWWKADRSSYCGGAARYYIDCNAKPGTHHRCHCNTGSCDQRRVACNIFRYGQCNTQIHGVTAVVCRQISCRPPWEIYPGHCGKSSATDNNTAQHTAPCLTRSNTFPALPTYPAAPSTLGERHSLRYPHRLTSGDRHTTVVFTQTGNLVLRNNHGRAWTSGTSGQAAGGQAHLYANGEFAILNRRGVKVWSTHTGVAGARAQVQLRNSGALVVVVNGRVAWSSHTHTP